jgi:hypothetical protein
MSENRPEDDSDRQQGQVATRDLSDQTDVFLDVPELKVEEINLRVEGLHVKVSLQAEVLQLLKLSVGVDADLATVDLTIKGVEVQAQLQVRLDNVARIIDRVLATIDEHPDIVTNLTRGAGQAVTDVGGGAKQTVGEVGGGAGEAAKEVGGGASEAAKEVGGGAGEATREIGGGAGEAAKGVGGGAGEAARGSKASKAARALSTGELLSALGHRSAEGVQRVLKRITKEE